MRTVAALSRRVFGTVLALASAGASADSSLPPRTIDDVVAELRAARNDTEQIAAARKLLETAMPDGLPPAEISARHVERGRAAEMLGLTDRYLGEYRAALAAANTAGGEIDKQLLIEYTAAETHAGNILNAIRIQERSAGTAWAAGARMASDAYLAESKARLGDLEGARRHLERAEAIFFELRSSPGQSTWGLLFESSIERARGGVALGSGRYAEAEAHFRNAADLRERDLPFNLRRIERRLDTPGQRMAVNLMLIGRRSQADMAAALGRLVEAEVLYRESLRRALAESGAGSPLPFIYAHGLAQIVLEQGRLDDAEKLAGAVIDILERQGAAPASRVLTGARYQRASVQVMKGRWSEALREYGLLEAAFADDGELRRLLGQGSEEWALALVRAGRSGEAVTMMERIVAERTVRLAGDGRSLATARAFLGLALAAAGRNQEALAQFRGALPRLVSGNADSDEGATATSWRQVVLLEAYLDLLYELHRGGSVPPDFDAVGEAFQAADIARASTVQRALTASAARTAIRDPRLAALAREEQDLGHRVAVLKETLSRLQSAPAEQRLNQVVADMRRDIPALLQRRTELRQRIAKEHPEYMQLVDPRPVTPDQARRLLGPGEALVAIYAGASRTYLWALKPDGALRFAAAELGRDEIARRVAHLRRGLDLGSSGDIEEAGFDVAAAHDLYARLLRPVEAGFAGADSLLVVPHAALGQLPFAVLPTAPAKLGASQLAFDAYRRVPWLLRQAAVTQLPSVSTLAALRGAAAPAGSGERLAFLGFGDPVFDAGRSGDAGGRPISRSAIVRNGPGARGPHSATIADLASLPDTAAEIREIAAVLRADPEKDVRLGKAASETSVRAADLSRYRVLAFATHGLIPGDLNGLTQPALALSNPAVTGETDADGLLTMDEVLGLRLDADWVVLSACNTAAGGDAASEAVSGLGRAFFYAGTRALLVTHWPVETVSAKLITTQLFRRQAEQPALPRSQALRQAMLAVMESNAIDQRTGKPDYAYAHPLFWAPYSLVGDGSGSR